jgi:hypothetical protein
LLLNTSKRFQDSLTNDTIDFTSGKETNFLAKIFIFGRAKNGVIDIVTKMTRLNIMRRSFAFFLSLITTILFVFILMTLIFGSFVISDSLNASFYKGTGGENTVMIVQKSHETFFSKAFNLFEDRTQENEDDFDFSESKFNYIPIQKFLNNTRPEDLQIDDRLFLEKEVEGATPSSQIEGVIENDINPGISRKSKGFLVGINNPIPKWDYYGRNPQEFDNFNPNELIIGEKLVWDLFVDPFKGWLFFQDRPTSTFTVSSILIDPFLGGNAVYMQFDKLISLYKLNRNDRNVILLNTANSSYISFLKLKLRSINPDLTVFHKKYVITRNN